MILPCCIIEDEEPAVELLTIYVKQHPQLILKGAYHHTKSVPGELLNGQCLLFLDIQLPYQSGLQFLEQQKNKLPVIFTTSHEQHALKAFNLSVLDYLLKPFSIQRFNQAVDKALVYMTGSLIERNEKYITVNDDYKKVKIMVDEILYIEALKQYVKIYTLNKRYMIIQTLKSLEQELANDGFVRCHKSYIINRKKVDSYNQSQVIINGQTIPCSKKFVFSD